MWSWCFLCYDIAIKPFERFQSHSLSEEVIERQELTLGEPQLSCTSELQGQARLPARIPCFQLTRNWNIEESWGPTYIRKVMQIDSRCLISRLHDDHPGWSAMQLHTPGLLKRFTQVDVEVATWRINSSLSALRLVWLFIYTIHRLLVLESNSIPLFFFFQKKQKKKRPTGLAIRKST
jgi:hypothetical protein